MNIYNRVHNRPLDNCVIHLCSNNRTGDSAIIKNKGDDNMRIISYTKELAEEGYRVIGANPNDGRKWDWEMDTDPGCVPLEMSFVESIVMSQEDVIKLADSDMFMDDEYARENYADFRDNYADILRGECPDWQLNAFRVFVGGVELYFANPKTNDSGFLWIIGAEHLKLTFKAPRTRLGFNPVYEVYIVHENGEHLFTRVDEDLGYIRYENEIKLKDPDKKDDNLFHDDNQYLVVTEYAGL